MLTVKFENVGLNSLNGKTIFSALSAVFSPGTLTVVRGDKGSGKTAFTRLLSGIIIPETGTVTAFDQDMQPLSHDSYRQRVGIIAAWQLLPDELSPLEVFSFWLPDADPYPLLTYAGLAEDRFDTPISKFTDEECLLVQQAVIYGRTPGLLIIDEPTANIHDWYDRHGRHIIEFARRAGTTTVMTLDKSDPMDPQPDQEIMFPSRKK